jgi:hypothetical protein
MTYEEYTGSDNEVDATVLCDSCLTAFYDEGFPEDADPSEVAWMGGDIPDHLCDKREGGGEIRCDCACNEAGQ